MYEFYSASTFHQTFPTGCCATSRVFLWSGTYFLLGAATLLLDFFTGPFLQFPILFVVPVALAAGYCGPRTAYALAVFLPIGRMGIAVWVDQPSPYPYIIANGLVRIIILTLIANLISRTAKQNRELKQKVESLVKICGWTPLEQSPQPPA